MVSDIDPRTLIEDIGHEGLEIVRPEELGNLKYRGFHPQELLEALYLWYCKSFRYIEMNPRVGTEEVNEFVFKNPEHRFRSSTLGCSGVLIGFNGNREPHAVAFESNASTIMIHDPVGLVYTWKEPLHQFTIREAYVLI